MNNHRTRIFLADGQADERMALRLVLQSLDMQVVGEAADWPTTLARAPATQLEMLLVEWALLPAEARTALDQLRVACSHAITVVLIGPLDPRQQAALSAGADVFISKGETPAQVAERLRTAAKRPRVGRRAHWPSSIEPAEPAPPDTFWLPAVSGLPTLGNLT